MCFNSPGNQWNCVSEIQHPRGPLAVLLVWPLEPYDGKRASKSDRSRVFPLCSRLPSTSSPLSAEEHFCRADTQGLAGISSTRPILAVLFGWSILSCVYVLIFDQHLMWCSSVREESNQVPFSGSSNIRKLWRVCFLFCLFFLGTHVEVCEFLPPPEVLFVYRARKCDILFRCHFMSKGTTVYAYIF